MAAAALCAARNWGIHEAFSRMLHDGLHAPGHLFAPTALPSTVFATVNVGASFYDGRLFHKQEFLLEPFRVSVALFGGRILCTYCAFIRSSISLSAVDGTLDSHRLSSAGAWKIGHIYISSSW